MKSIEGWTPRRVDELIGAKSWEHSAADYDADIKLGAPVGQSEASGKLENIVRMFQDRYDQLHKIMRRECGFIETGTIAHVRRNSWEYHSTRGNPKSVNLIGMVASLGRTGTGNLRVELEDKTGSMKVYIPKSNPLAATIVVDDVIGLTGSFRTFGTGDGPTLFWCERVQFPEILHTHQNKGGLDFDPLSIAFVSDLHMGSKEFMEKEWDKMMEWINSDDQTAKNIKYLVCSGDVVDGVGVYPGHENNLGASSDKSQSYATDMKNVYDQYEFFARKMDELPDHIETIILPGNHDAVRPAEPQPVLEQQIQDKFNSAIHVGNPARVSLSGIDVLSYHGKGIDDIVPRMENVTYERPAEAMKLMLQKRHLAPMWGERNALSPEEEDQMVIREAPDVFVTGHTHAHQVEWHRGLSLIVSSTFQDETDFMNMLGYQAKKAFVSVYNIQNRETRVIPFHSE